MEQESQQTRSNEEQQNEREMQRESERQGDQQSSERASLGGASPREGGQRWATITAHAAFPGAMILGFLWGALSGSGAAAAVGFAAAWTLIALIAQLTLFFLSKAYREVRFHSSQALLWTLLFWVAGNIVGLAAVSLGILVLLPGAVYAGLGAYRVFEGSAFRYPGAAFLIEVRKR